MNAREKTAERAWSLADTTDSAGSKFCDSANTAREMAETSPIRADMLRLAAVMDDAAMLCWEVTAELVHIRYILVGERRESRQRD